jgi:regulator of RNase E activity RraA
MPVGLRIYTQRGILPSKELIEKFKKIQAANVADCMGRSCAMSSEIKLMTRPQKECMVGVALTVKARSGDNLFIHKALNMAQEGDVIVVSNEGDRSHSLLGEIMVAYAKSKNIAGMVIDGPIRDVVPIYDMGLPLYATGSTPGGPYKEGPGEINVPISCGGVVVAPGDIIIGDPDGVIVVPKNDAEAVLEKAIKFSEQDDAKLLAAKEGRADRSKFDQLIEAKGVEIIDDYYRI